MGLRKKMKCKREGKSGHATAILSMFALNLREKILKNKDPFP